jgi:hypothetical protein
MECERLLELGLDQPLVVGEHEAGAGHALAQFGRVRDRPGLLVGVVGRLTVGHVQRVGGLSGVEAGDGGVGVGAARRHVDGVVGVKAAGLPALGVQEPLAVGVDVRLEPRLDPVDEALHGLGLRLGRRARAAVRLARGVGRRALVVVTPMGVEVTVRVDTVTHRYLAVAVVVAHVLAPQPLVVVGELVAIGVGDEHEPQLGRPQQTPDLGVVGPPPVEEVVQEPAVDLAADPLPGVLQRRVEDGWARAVGHAASALGQLEGDELATLGGTPEDQQLDKLRVPVGDLVQLVAKPARLIPGPPHLEAGGALGGRLLTDRLAPAVALDDDPDAGGDQLGAFRASQNRVRLDAGGGALGGHQLQPAGRPGDALLAALQRVHLEPKARLGAARPLLRSGGRDEEPDDSRHDEDPDPRRHDVPPPGSASRGLPAIKPTLVNPFFPRPFGQFGRSLWVTARREARWSRIRGVPAGAGRGQSRTAHPSRRDRARRRRAWCSSRSRRPGGRSGFFDVGSREDFAEGLARAVAIACWRLSRRAATARRC